jgi:Carboxypeptidase regulatory-like domain/TonB dependent receptor/TonB-dependent Receptor Plug Domain
VRGKGLVAFLASFVLPLSAAVTFSGRVVDENDAPVQAAHVHVGSADAQTDPTGIFKITLPAPGDYLISITREGYYAVKDRSVHIEGNQDVTLVINSVREVFQSENVHAETSPVDVGQAQSQERLSGTEVNDMPYANSHSLRNSLQLMPAIVQDASGTLHVNGSSENQVLYLLNGFNITNPITGLFQPILAVEGIRSVDLSSGRSSPAYGKGTAGVLAINTESGTDKFHWTSTDFIPGLNIQQGLHLGNWYPRFGVSGPIVRGRAWFSDTIESEYSESVVTALPSGQNTRSGWAGSNLLHTQANLTPSNILFADFLANVDNEGRVGLGALNPVSTTSNLHSHEYFASVKDQKYFGHGALIEFGYAHNDFFQAQSPQGPELYVISTTGNSGNNFLNDTQAASRDQGMVQAYLPKFKLAGSHQIEVGTDVDWLHYTGDFSRTGYQVLGLTGQLLSETLFPSPARFHVTDTEMSAYVLDTWRVSKRLQFNVGVREDWDRRIGDSAWSPRAAFSWSPLASAHTRISGGYAITHDAVTLGMLGMPFDQTALTTVYNAEGAPSGPALPTSFAIGNSGLVLPRASNWTLDADHQLFTHVYLTAKYLRRRGTDGFAFINTLAPDAPPSLLPLPGADAAGTYQLTNLRQDDYDSIALSVRQTLSGQFEWMAAYTHARAVSNGVLDPNTAQPLQVLPDLVAMPWDVPNRILGWAYLPLPWKNWAISALADMRSGFPFSVRDETGVIVGAVDSYHYPINFDLNIAIERMITLRGYRFALRGGMDNVTNQENPTAVNNVVGGANYLKFLGDEGRHFVVRVRFFGRAGGK